jgi:hypothetical protein
MKHIKRIGILLITGFLALAPPGTLIFGLILIVGLIGNVWFTVGGIFSIVVLATVLLVRRNTVKRGCVRSDIDRRL